MKTHRHIPGHLLSILALIFFSTLLRGAEHTGPNPDSPEAIGKRVVQKSLKRYVGWRYQKACTYYGALIFADATGDADITALLEEAYAPYKEGKRKSHTGHVDHNLFGIWPLELYRQTGAEAYLEQGLYKADDEYAQPREDGLTPYTRFWVDDMYMVGSLQVQAYKATQDRVYLDRAAHFLKAYCDSLQRPNGLFYHRADVPFYWGRGNGWAVAGLTEVLLVLPPDHEHHAALKKAYTRMMSTLASCQGEDGMWHQLIDDPESYAESSSTGMFLFGLITGVDQGWLPEAEFTPVVEKGWKALASHVDEKGRAMKVCIGTNAKNRKSNYTKRMNTKGNMHGQAAVLWAATAMVRWQQ